MGNMIFNSHTYPSIIKRKNTKLHFILDEKNDFIVDEDYVSAYGEKFKLSDIRAISTGYSTKYKSNALIIYFLNGKEFGRKYKRKINGTVTHSGDKYFLYSNDIEAFKSNPEGYIDTHKVDSINLENIDLKDYSNYSTSSDGKKEYLLYENKKYVLDHIVPLDIVHYYNSRENILFKSKILGDKYVDVWKRGTKTSSERAMSYFNIIKYVLLLVMILGFIKILCEN